MLVPEAKAGDLGAFENWSTATNVTVFLLRDVEGLSVKETADALGLSEANNVARTARRASISASDGPAARRCRL
jgi:hypothetical protein